MFFNTLLSGSGAKPGQAIVEAEADAATDVASRVNRACQDG